MTSSDRALIAYFEVRVPPKPNAVSICTPCPGMAVPPDFDAKGYLTPPDNYITSCDVNGQDTPTSITYILPPPPPEKWIASFHGVHLQSMPVPLTARGDGGGKYSIAITVSTTAPPPGDCCIGLTAGPEADYEQQASGSEPTVKIEAIRVKRRAPAQPGGYALRLELRGTDKADFTVGGTLPAQEEPVQECVAKSVAGEYRAKQVVNERQEWYAVFQNVPPGNYDLTAKTGAGVTDRVSIQVTATK
jgi:hypothetical protein